MPSKRAAIAGDKNERLPFLRRLSPCASRSHPSRLKYGFVDFRPLQLSLFLSRTACALFAKRVMIANDLRENGGEMARIGAIVGDVFPAWPEFIIAVVIGSLTFMEGFVSDRNVWSWVCYGYLTGRAGQCGKSRSLSSSKYCLGSKTLCKVLVLTFRIQHRLAPTSGNKRIPNVQILSILKETNL